MADTYTPTEAQIAAVLEKYTPRQVAVAYLRASRRARDAELSFQIMSDIADLTSTGLTGDIDGATAAVAAVEAAEWRLRTHNETSEGMKANG